MSIGGLFGPAPEAPEAPAIPRSGKAGPRPEQVSPVAKLLAGLGPRVGDITFTIVRVGGEVASAEAAELRVKAELATMGVTLRDQAWIDGKTLVAWGVADHAALLADILAGRGS